MSLPRSLYFSPVGKAGKDFLAAVVKRFPRQMFDFFIVSFDDTDFGDLGSHLHIEKARGQKWRLAKKFLTPERVSRYEYVFIWDDDLDTASFDPLKFLHIARRNKLDVVQPALSPDSYWFHPITVKKAQPVGRLTNFVEIMCPVYSSRIWPSIYPYIDPDLNEWGWGYDLIPLGRKGIVDCMSVRHTRPGRSGNLGAEAQYVQWCHQYNVSRPPLTDLAALN